MKECYKIFSPQADFEQPIKDRESDSIYKKLYERSAYYPQVAR
jgi:hypothetical protein